MEVKLLYHTPLSVLVYAIRAAYDSYHLSDSNFNEFTDEIGDKDKQLINKVVNKFKHESTMEHIVYTFELIDFPRYTLQELVRHRIASYTIRSTRFTLNKDAKKEIDPANFLYTDNMPEPIKYLTIQYIRDLFKLKDLFGYKNDILKKGLLENYLTSGVMTINARSLRNFFNLRLDSHAHEDIRKLAGLMFSSLPEEHKILLFNNPED